MTTLPKPTDAGNPDFRLWNGTDRIVGYVEAKKPTEERLDLIEESEQLMRYRSTFPNLILTNFLEFRLYRNGERVESVLAAPPVGSQRVFGRPPPSKRRMSFRPSDRFSTFSPQGIHGGFPGRRTGQAHALPPGLVGEQLDPGKDTPGTLAGFFEAFRTYLIGTLTPEDFTDLFAQTITYGLFAAPNPRRGRLQPPRALDGIPHSIGVLGPFPFPCAG